MSAEKQQEKKAVARRDPFTVLDPFEDWELPFGRGAFRLGRMFEDRFGPRMARWSPAVDLSEDDGKYVFSVELPGTKREDVSVELHDNVLTIHGEKKSEREEKKEQRRWIERSYGSFSRSFTLPANAVSERVNASFRDGVLTVEIPKAEQAKPKVVSIKSG